MADPAKRLTPDDITSARDALRRCAASNDIAACLVGFDGFVDSIIDAVDSRQAPGPDGYTRMTSATQFAQRAEAAAGRSANIEFVVKQTRIGGAGPILAGALAQLGGAVHAIAALDHPIFDPLRNACASCVSLGEPGATDAIEFDDGKLMLGKAAPMDRITWDHIITQSGSLEALINRCNQSTIIAPCGWTMIPAMNDIWANLASNILPRLNDPREKIFFVDFSDPAKRPDADLRAGLILLRQINTITPVTLGLNLAEAQRIAGLLPAPPHSSPNASPNDSPNDSTPPDAVSALADSIHRKTGLCRIAVHSHFGAAIADDNGLISSPTAHTPTPLTSTGAGDHFNAGLCFALSRHLDATAALSAAIAVSGLFVRTGQHPSVSDVIGFLDNIPASGA